MRSLLSSSYTLTPEVRTNTLILTQAIGFYLWGEFFKFLQVPDDSYTLRLLVCASSLLGFLFLVFGRPTPRLRDALINGLVLFSNIQVAVSTHYTDGHYVGLLGGMIVIAAGISITRGTSAGLLLSGFWVVAVPVIIATTPGIEFPKIFATSYLTAVFVGFLAFVDYETALRQRDESLNLARRVVDNMAEAVLFYSGTGAVTLSNQAMDGLFQTDGSSIKGKRVEELPLRLYDASGALLAPEELPSNLARATRKPVINFQASLERRDGSRRFVLINAIPLESPRSAVNVLLTIQDVTDLEDARREIEAQKLALSHSAKMSALGEMAAGIAHEINNPLAIILGRVEQIKLVGNLDPEVLRFVDSLEHGVNRIASIIRSMRLITKDDATSFDDGRIDVTQAVTTVINLFSEKLKSLEIELTQSFQAPFEVDGNPGQLAQAFMNIFQNAIQSQEQRFIRWIRVEVFQEQALIIIRVTNNGAIPDDIRHKIGQPFFTTREVGEGSGLGIANSMQIVRALGGDIVFDSQAGTTHFDIRLKRRQTQ